MRVEPEAGKWRVPTQDEHERNLERRARDAALRRSKARAAVGDDPEKLAALEAEQDEERDGEGDDAINALLREMKDERFAWEDPLPGRMKVAFKDVLPKVNVDLRPYLRTLRFLDTSTQDRVSTELCHMALQEHSDSWAPLFRYLPDSLLYPSGVPTLHALQPEVDKLLFGVDWETRGLNALALLWESPVCDDMVGPFLTTMKICSPGIPPKLVEGIDALLRRIEWKERAEAKAAADARATGTMRS